MKKSDLFLTVICLMGFTISINAQSGLKEKIVDEDGTEYCTGVDNISYWVELAEKGLVPFNQSIPVKPAENKSPLINIDGVVINSTDIVILNNPDYIQSENSVFIDPDNTLHVLNSNNSRGWDGSGATTGYGASYFYTYTGGYYWSGSYVGAGGTNKGDPAACISTSGREFIGSISSGRGQGVAYSDNGSSWTYVTVGADQTSPDLLDKNHLWIDNTSSSSTEGYLYDAWTNFDYYNDPYEIEFSRSTDNGVSWSSPYTISSNTSAGFMNHGVNICCNNTGWAFACWAVYDDWSNGVYGEDAIAFARSPNGGASFYAAQIIQDDILGIREETPNPTGKNMRVNSFPSMTIDVSGGTYHGHQYIVWANVGVPGTNTGTNVSIYMIKSTNGGTVWSTPVRINQGTSANGYASYFPWITCDPVTGNLFCIFYDDRDLGISSSAVETWLAYSTDGGTTWDDFRISDVSFTPSPVPNLAAGYFGDYLGVTAKDNFVYPAWTDNRSGRALTYVSPFVFDGPCIATGGGSEYISRVQIGSIDNVTGSDNYTDYTSLSTNIALSGTESLTVNIGNPYSSSDQCGVWVDWNKDNDFDDANETISVSGTPGWGPYTATIDPPIGTSAGECTMRVRITYSGDVDPCGATSFGEVEDYTLNLTGTAGLWTGAVSTNWNTAGNWDDGLIPTSGVDVTIPSGTPYQPTIGTGTSVQHAYCENLTIQSGAVLTQTGTNTFRSYFRVHGNFDSDAGTFTQNTNYAFLYFDGATSTSWDDDNMNDTYTNVRVDKDNPTQFVVMWQDMTVSVSFEIREGIFKIDPMATWTLTVNGVGINAFEVEYGGTATLVGNQVIDVAGDIEFDEGSQANVTGGIFKCGSDFRVNTNTAYDIQFTGGTLEMDGSGTQNIEDSDGNTQLFDLLINKSAGECILQNGNLTVLNNIELNSGTLNSNNLDVYIGNDWTFSGGTFNPTTGTVYFWSQGDVQSVNGTGTFYNVYQVNTGNYLHFNDPTTINSNLELHYRCWAYNIMDINGTLNIDDPDARYSAWGASANSTIALLNQGGHLICSQGTLTVLDLDEAGLEGTTHLYSGTMNIHQPAGFLDLNGSLTIDDGQMNLHGSGSSFWPYTQDASLTMSGGVLDLHSLGIYVNDDWNFTDNISGGVIRTASAFYSYRADFTPIAGLFEFYDVGDAYINQYNGSTLFNVNIDKAASKSSSVQVYPIVADERMKTLQVKETKANEISLGSNFTITNDLTITSGSLNLNAHQLDVADEVNIYGHLIMNDPLDILINDFYINWNSGSTCDITAGEFHIRFMMFYDGSNVQIGTGNTIYTNGTSTAGIYNASPLAELGNLVIDMTLPSGYGLIYSGSTEPLYIDGDMTVLSGNRFDTQLFHLIVNGTLDIEAGAVMNVADPAGGGVLENNSDHTLNGILNVDYDDSDESMTKNKSYEGEIQNSSVSVGDNTDWITGEAYFHGDFGMATTGVLNLNGGSVIVDQEYAKGSSEKAKDPENTDAWQYLHGTINLTDGLFEISHNSLYFSSSSINNITGGTIRAGYTFYAVDPGIFQPSGGTVEFTGADPSPYINCNASAGNYFHDLIINRTNDIVHYSDIHVSNDLLISSGSLTLSGYTLTIDGDCQIDALLDVGPSGNVLNHGLFELGTTGALNITGGSFINDHPYGTDAWQKLYGTLNLSAGLFEIMYNSIDLESTFVDNISGGIMRTGTAFRALTAGTFEPIGGVVEFTGNSGMAGPYIYCDAGNYFHTFFMNSPVYYSVATDLEVRGNMTVDYGLLEFYSFDLTCLGDVNINSGGVMNFGTNSALQLDDGSFLNVNSGGEIQLIGTAGNEAMVTHISTGTYNFHVHGTIGAEYAIFEHTEPGGVFVHNFAFVDPVHSFNYCTFQNGTPGSATLLTIHNDETIIITEANFPGGGISSYNVSKVLDHGHVTMDNATGSFAGPAFENDDYDRIDWTGFVSGLWTGAVSSDWFTPGNWSDGIVPDATVDVTIPAGTPNDPVINGAAAFCNDITIDAGASLEVGNNTLNVADDLDIFGELIMTDPSSVINVESYVTWKSGSTDNVNNGEIHCGIWSFEDGTNAVIDPPNTAYVKFGILNSDPDAWYGNLTGVAISKDETIVSKGGYPTRVSGNFTIQSGANWIFSEDSYITGSLIIENGGFFSLLGVGNFMDVSSASSIDGFLAISDNYFYAHDSFEIASSGELEISGGEFICDYNQSSGWMTQDGDITMTDGLFEFSNSSLRFSGTSAISGGIVRVGRTFTATSSGAFQPTAGTLELIGASGAHYIHIVNGNYAYNFNVNRAAPIGINLSSPLNILNDLTLTSTLNSNNNTITVAGNIDINSGGSLNMEANSILEIGAAKTLSVNSGGTLSVVGTMGNEATVTHIGGYYGLSVLGGTISAEYGIFEYMNTVGVYLAPVSIVDAGHPLDNCTFRNGAASGRLLTVSSHQTFTVTNAIFPTNTWSGSYNVYKSVDEGVVNFSNATGGFDGEAYDYDPHNRVHWTVPSFDLDLTVFLEGPFNTGTLTMDTDINGLIPNNHPFNPTLPYFGNPTPDWYYTGSENTPTPNTNIVDWVLVELRDATSASAAGPGTMIAQQAAFLLNTGEVVDLDGASLLNFAATINDGLYIAIWQRNHLGIISASALSLSSGTYTYDFSTGSGQAYGGASAHTLLGSGIWGMMSGDGNGDGDVLPIDKFMVWDAQVGTNGYLEADFNLDTEVMNQDKNDFMLPNNGQGSQIPE